MCSLRRDSLALIASAILSCVFVTAHPALADPNGNFIALVYQDLLQRQPDNGSLNSWENFLTLGGTRNSFVLQIEGGNECLDLLIDRNYQHLLHRPADSAGVTAFLPFLVGGGRIEQMQSTIVGSPEYFVTRSGSTNSGFVGTMYSDLLNRSPDAGELTFLLQTLGAGATRSDVALSTLNGLEYRRDFVSDAYLQFLRRTADPTGLNFYANAMQQGLTDQQVVAALLSSDEYFNFAQSIPEPACVAGMLAACGGMVMRRRRRPV